MISSTSMSQRVKLGNRSAMLRDRIAVSECNYNWGRVTVPQYLRAVFDEDTGTTIYLNFLPTVIKTVYREDDYKIDFDSIVKLIADTAEHLIDCPFNRKITIVDEYSNTNVGGYLDHTDEEGAVVFSITSLYFS